MNELFLTDNDEWPNKDDDGNPQWLHSHVREVAYSLNYKVYEEFVELSNLDDPAK